MLITWGALLLAIAPQDLTNADQAAQENRFDEAIAALKIAEKEAVRAGSEAALTQIQERAITWLDWKKHYDKVKFSFEALTKTPDEPLHNLIAGRFVIFIKGDWASGIPMFLNYSVRFMPEVDRIEKAEKLARAALEMACCTECPGEEPNRLLTGYKG